MIKAGVQEKGVQGKVCIPLEPSYQHFLETPSHEPLLKDQGANFRNLQLWQYLQKSYTTLWYFLSRGNCKLKIALLSKPKLKICIRKVAFWRKIAKTQLQEVTRGLDLEKRPFPDGSISCQNPLRLSSGINGRYDLQIITSWRFGN